MSTQPIQPDPSSHRTAAHSAPASESSSSGGLDPFGNQSGYFAALFVILLTSMTIRQGTLITQSKQISENASIQNALNNANAEIKFSVLPAGANTAEIDKIQEQNEQYAAQRQNLQNSLITCRQVAEVTMTQASTNVNILQQDASEDSGWLQTLNTVFQVIDEMTQT